MDFEPIRDDKKPLTIREFEELLAQLAKEYADEFEGTNEFHQQPHNFYEWLSSFRRWISW